MRHLALGLALATIVTARPDLYREKEDFQYSRSSSDEGSKSGYYDAQRGNMGGNYERAHNMDTLAQHQMGGLVNQVEGELAGGSKTRTGSVFSSANTRGVYGSGHYDLSNLQGRNFQEGMTFDNSQLHTLSKSEQDISHLSSNNARYRSSGYADNSDYRAYQANSLQDAQRLYGTNQYEQGLQTGSNSRYSTQSGYQDRNIHSQSQLNIDEAAQNLDANIQHRFISTVPVKIIVRPGQRVAIPVATQTYRDSRIASYHDQNAINSEAEIVNSNGIQANYKPASTGKHYESAYSYHKEVQDHDTRHVVVPTIYPVSKNSEAHGDSSLNYGSQNSNNRYEHSSDQRAEFSQSRYDTGLNTEHKNSASANSNLNTYSQLGSQSDINSHSADLIGAINSKPKSYQSSYSYHKSWERQGDPYVIKPVSNGIFDGTKSERLTDSATQDLYPQVNGYNCIYECKTSYTRVARSYSADNTQTEQDQSQNLEHFGQQNQDQWRQSEFSGQQLQSKWDTLEDFSQQTQDKSNNLEGLGQQIQTAWDKTEVSGQQTQNLDDFNQQAQNLEEFNQQTQNLEDFNQQSQNLEDFNQQSQSKLNNVEDMGQQTQNTFENIENLAQEMQSKWDIQNTSQQSLNQFDAIEDLGQQTQNKWDQQEDLGQQTQNKWDQQEDLGQQTQNQWHTDFTGQQPQVNTEHFRSQQKDDAQHIQDTWDKFDKAENTALENTYQQTEQKLFPVETNKGARFDNKLNESENIQQTHRSNERTFSIWNKIDNDKFVHTEEQPIQLEGMSEKQNGIGNSQQSETRSYQQEHNIWDKIENLNVSKDSSNERETTIQKTQGIWDVIKIKEELLKQNNSKLSDKIFENKSTENNSQDLGFLSDLQGNLNNFSNKESSTDIDTEPQTEKINGNELRPVDIGRGDIGPEGLILDIASTESNYDFNNKRTDKFKNNHTSNDEMNAFHFVIRHETQEETNNRSVLTFGPSNQTEQKNEFKRQEENIRPIGNFDPQINIEQQSSWNLKEKDNKNLHQHDMQRFDTFDQQSIIEQKDNQAFHHQDMKNFNSFDEQSNMEHQINWNIEQKQNHDFDDHNMHPFNNFDQKSTNKQESNWNIERKYNNNLNHQDMTKLNSFYEQSNIDQQSHWNGMEHSTSIDQHINIEQQNKLNIEQKQNQEFDDLNMHHFNNFDQQSNNDQQNMWNMEQKENMNQQNIDPLTNFDQQSNTVNQSDWNIEQKENHDFNQQSKQYFNSYDQKSYIDNHGSWNLQQSGSQGINKLTVKDLSHFDQQRTTEQEINFNLEQQNSQLHLEEFSQQNQDIRKTLDINKYFEQQQLSSEYNSHHKSNDSESVEYIPVPDKEKLNTHNQNDKNSYNGQTNIEAVNEAFLAVPKIVYNASSNGISITKVKHQSNDDSSSTIETITEKPGFWKSVGNKFKNAKDRVSSWFGR